MLAIFLGSMCCVIVARGQCRTTLNVVSRDEFYFYASDALSAIDPLPLPISPFLQPAVGLLESLQTGCGTMDMLGIQISIGPTNSINYSFVESFPLTLPTIAGAVSEFIEEGVSLNGIATELTPTISTCNRTPYKSITHFGGSASLYVAHMGSGSYPKKISEASFHTCRDVIIENASTNAIELPVKIQGSVFAAGSFALDEFTFGHARLRAWGSIGGEAFVETAEVTAADIFPESADINIVRRFTVAPGQGKFIVHIEVSAESVTEVQAKGGGLFGLITASATAGVDFPNSIDIGRFTGKDGAPLPNGVKIYDASARGSFYEITTPVIEILPGNQLMHPFRIYAPTGAVCQLQTSTNLLNWTLVLTTNVSASPFNYTITNVMQSPRGFFRVIQP